jgi:hypothetical protein
VSGDLPDNNPSGLGWTSPNSWRSRLSEQRRADYSTEKSCFEEERLPKTDSIVSHLDSVPSSQQPQPTNLGSVEDAQSSAPLPYKNQRVMLQEATWALAERLLVGWLLSRFTMPKRTIQSTALQPGSLLCPSAEEFGVLVVICSYCAPLLTLPDPHPPRVQHPTGSGGPLRTQLTMSMYSPLSWCMRYNVAARL